MDLQGPSQEVDAEIAALIGIESRSRRDRNGRSKGREWLEDRHGGVETWGRQPPAYTASLDAAMTLVPEECDFGVGSFDDSVKLPWAWVRTDETEGHAATPALALTAAALLARGEQS
jgi:hypothetical protein